MWSHSSNGKDGIGHEIISAEQLNMTDFKDKEPFAEEPVEMDEDDSIPEKERLLQMKYDIYRVNDETYEILMENERNPQLRPFDINNYRTKRK